MTIIRAMLSVNKIQAALKITGQAVTKKWFDKININW